MRLVARLVLAASVAWSLVGALPLPGATGDDDEKAGGFVAVPSPITSGVVRGVKRDCEALLRSGARVIVLEIQPGKSDYEECLKLAGYVASIQGAQTVSFVPRPLSGHAVIVALAADELVMAEKAAIGDIGAEEKFISPVMYAGYSDLARKRRPAHEALILGMLDKELEVWEARTTQGKSYVLGSDLEKFEQQQKVLNKEVVIPKGQLGYFNGHRAKSLALAKLLAESRAEVAAAYGLPPKSAIETVRVGVQWRPVRIRIADFISVLTQEYVRRHVKESIEHGKNFFIFEIDSYGGDAQAGLDMAEYIKDLEGVRTVAYIPKNAISAAAFIALGCDEIIMHRDAKLGDCGVMFIEGGQFHFVEPKLVSIVSTALETIATAKGYPPALARAMIEQDLVVKEVHDPRTGSTLFLSEQELEARAGENLQVRRVVKDKGRFLTMDGTTAQSLDFATDLVDNFDGLLAHYGLEDIEIAVVQPNWVDTLIWVLNRPPIKAILLIVGVLCLYLELKLPGISLPGLVAALCFLLFFWSQFMGGTATALEIVLFLAGALCLGLEIFVLPGFGVFGVTGILLMIVSVVLASQTFVLPQGSSQWRELSESLGSVVFAFVCLFGFAFLAGKYLPSVPLLGRVVLTPDQVAVTSDSSAGLAAGPLTDLLDAEGIAMTPLRPAGRVRFGDQFIDVVTDGSYINEGTRVRVIDVSGRRVVVRQV
jgi:membrane-bound serine protease (ClpP class)